jgi:hypothetical protein
LNETWEVRRHEAETMNRTIKDTPDKVLHYQDLGGLKARVMVLMTANNSFNHLKALR